MKKRFAFMRLLQPSNSKTAKRKRASFYSWKKRGKKKKKRKKEDKRSKGKLEASWLSRCVRRECRYDGGTQGYPSIQSLWLSIQRYPV